MNVCYSSSLGMLIELGKVLYLSSHIREQFQ
jgi:hypothetical protein